MSVQRVQLELDSNVRRVSNGTALLGGSPFRLIRLSTAGARLLDGWLAGSVEAMSAKAQELQLRLVNAGMLHPVVAEGCLPASLAFVVPVHDDVHGLAALLEALRRDASSSTIIVVDDASAARREIALAAASANATLIRHENNRGPAAARNTGWAVLDDDIDIVFFLDADVVPEPGAVARVVAHLGDAACVAAAPRVRAANGADPFDSYEGMQSPLDLGERPSLVRVGAQVSYVPSAALAVRRSALVELSGFDEGMRFGEDVDLIWRLTQNETNVVRYEPTAIVRHRSRPTVFELMRQRFSYGSSAAPLGKRHGTAVTPLRLPLSMLAGWIAALVGGRLGMIAAAAGAVVSTAQLKAQLASSVERPGSEAARLMAQAHGRVAGALVNAATRTYAPLMLLTSRTRRPLLLGAVVSPVVAWLRARPSHGLLHHLALKNLDDAAYCAGVWTGAWRERSAAALMPDVEPLR